MKFMSLVEGLTLDQDARDRIAYVWNRLRILAAVPALPVALGFAVFYDQTLYLAVLVLGVVLAAAISQRHQPRPAPLLTLDTIGTYLVVEILGIPPTTLGIPFTVLWVGAWLTTSGWPRVGVWVLGAVLSS